MTDRFYATPEEADMERRRLASKFVDTIPEDEQEELGALAQLNRAFHLRTDAFGERIPPEGMAILHRTEKALRQKIADRYGVPNNFEGLDQVLVIRFRFNSPEVKTVLAERADQKAK